MKETFETYCSHVLFHKIWFLMHFIKQNLYKSQIGGNCNTTFYGRNLLMSLISQSVCKTFQQSVIFVSKAGAYRGRTPEHLKGASPQGRLLAFPTDIRLGWKGLPATNTVAYQEHLYVTAVKCFITSAGGVILADKLMSSS